jgi:hypothetical protein
MKKKTCIVQKFKREYRRREGLEVYSSEDEKRWGRNTVVGREINSGQVLSRDLRSLNPVLVFKLCPVFFSIGSELRNLRIKLSSRKNRIFMNENKEGTA